MCEKDRGDARWSIPIRLAHCLTAVQTTSVVTPKLSSVLFPNSPEYLDGWSLETPSDRLPIFVDRLTLRR